MKEKVHCCDDMADFIDPKCAEHPNPADCEDALAQYDPITDSYALLARFGSSWVTTIKFCPWCGDKKRNLRDQYFDELDALGIELLDEKPEKYKSAAWWQEKGL